MSSVALGSASICRISTIFHSYKKLLQLIITCKPYDTALSFCRHRPVSADAGRLSKQRLCITRRVTGYLWSRWQALKLCTRLMYPTRSAAPPLPEDPAMVATREEDGESRAERPERAGMKQSSASSSPRDSRRLPLAQIRA